MCIARMELKIGEHALLRCLKLLSRPEIQILIFATLFLILYIFSTDSLGFPYEPFLEGLQGNPKESVEIITKILH